jgi:Ulp1 family protease
VCFKKIASYIDEHEQVSGVIHSQKWKFEVVSVVQQPNHYDCGVLMCHILKHLVRNDALPVWETKDCAMLRLMMAWELLEQWVRT